MSTLGEKRQVGDSATDMRVIATSYPLMRGCDHVVAPPPADILTAFYSKRILAMTLRSTPS